MKKMMALVLCLALILSAACAETADASVFETMAGLEWSFCSGAGGWSTDMKIMADGSFSGEYHDSEMGDSADAYPDGTVYFCSFSGQMSLAEQVDEKTWKIRVDKLEEKPAEESIADGIRYIPAEAYGLSEGDVMLLYSPGTPVSIFSEDMLLWTHVMEEEETPTELTNWFLCSEKNGTGFTGYPKTSLANPWEEMTAEQLTEAAGVSFGVPEGAENVVYRYLRSENLAEMQFTREGGAYCARIQPLALKAGELADISGMYYEWEQEEEVTVGYCTGSLALARDGENMVERCLWYDLAPGLMYSLTVTEADVDGLDLTAIAEQVFVPMQGDA